MSNYSNPQDTPVITDLHMMCSHCKRNTIHRIVAYTDCEYRTCSACKLKTHLVTASQSRGPLVEADTRRPDATKKTDAFKRNTTRRYRKEKNKKDWED